jgi:hypothetical protein
LDGKPETELTVVESRGDVSSHLLVGGGVEVRAIPEGESWPIGEVRTVLKKES